MSGISVIEGVAAPLPAANIDTDIIMPKQFLKGIDRQGLDAGLFHGLRFDESGAERAQFILNQPAWRGARILVVGPNFGCGSSREHAVWGLAQSGIQAIIGSSFAGIFYDNCTNNGILAITLPEDQIAILMRLAGDVSSHRWRVDLSEQTIFLSESESVAFQIAARKKEALLLGLDAVGASLRFREQIQRFEADYFADQPWLQ